MGARKVVGRIMHAQRTFTRTFSGRTRTFISWYPLSAPLNKRSLDIFVHPLSVSSTKPVCRRRRCSARHAAS
eukprot:scaffold81827_cov57-Phaeocystis_antarctica.AAC.5